jgi:hypothetical protein
MPGSFRDNQPRRGQTDVYWRRRVIALAAGIVLAGLVAWTVNGTLDGGSARQSANVAHVTGQHAASPTPAGGTLGAAGTGSSAPQLTATPRPTASAHTKHRAGQASGKHRPGGGRPPARPAGAVQACAQADIVLSVFTSRHSYPAHSTPRFQVDVVSTAPRTCSVNLATRHLRVLITSGPHRVWDSAGCARPSGPRITKLTRGVPEVVQFTWDRTTSSPGCRLPRNTARPGTYSATAHSGSISSQPRIFVLRA